MRFCCCFIKGVVLLEAGGVCIAAVLCAVDVSSNVDFRSNTSLPQTVFGGSVIKLQDMAESSGCSDFKPYTLNLKRAPFFFLRFGCIARSLTVWLREPASFRSLGQSVGRWAGGSVDPLVGRFFPRFGCIARSVEVWRREPASFWLVGQSVLPFFFLLGESRPLSGRVDRWVAALLEFLLAGRSVGQWVGWPLFSFFAALLGLLSANQSVDRFRTVGRSDVGLRPYPALEFCQVAWLQTEFRMFFW